MGKIPSIRLSGKPARPRNSFDVSERALYTQPVGSILPVFVRDLNPGDHLEVNAASLLQAQTLKGRAFFNGKQKFAGFFVPYKQLWNGWESFITRLNPAFTSVSSKFMDTIPITRATGGDYFVKGFAPNKVPSFSPYTLLAEMWKIREDATLKAANNPFVSDIFGVRAVDNYARLMEHLGYGSATPFLDSSASTLPVGDSAKLSMSLFRFAAYQKIYQDYYLDDVFEVRNPFAYQLDAYEEGGAPGPNLVANAKNADNKTNLRGAMFQMRYAHYEKDILSNLTPTLLDISNTGTTGLPALGYNHNVGLNSTISSPYTMGQGGAISADELRALFALDKMYQISSRAGKSYKEQIAAHYGEDVRNLVDSCYYCGGFDKNLAVDAVIATAAGQVPDISDSMLGQQSGFIDSSNSGSITCDAKDFGVFMIVSYVSVEPRYSLGIDDFVNKLVASDYFHPEYEELGLQPVLAMRYGHDGGKRSLDDLNKVVSWQPRYSEYKSSYNKLYGPYAGGGNLSFLTPEKTFKLDLTEKKFSFDMFLVSPRSLDRTVEINYDGQAKTDPFRVETHFAATLISNMGVTGLPRLI